jgi:DNA-binding response OmpR family regulator
MKKILVVEDEIVVAMAMEMVLEAEGFAVVLATDGLEGLVLADTARPDLIITDLMMPRMDGATMIGRLRAAGHLVPVVLTTWIPEGKVRLGEGGDYGAFLSKPFNDSQLLATIRRCIG